MQRKTLMALTGGGVALLAIATVGLAMAHGNGMYDGHAILGGARPGFNDTNGSVDGRFVTLASSAATATLSAIDLKDVNSTHPLVASVQLALPAGATATAANARGGYAISDGLGDVIAVEDSPRAQLRGVSVNGTTVTMTLPAGATIVKHDAVDAWSPAGATVTYATGQKANLVLSKNATLAVDGQVLTIALGPASGFGFGIVRADGGFGGHGLGHGEGFERGGGHEAFGRGGRR